MTKTNKKEYVIYDNYDVYSEENKKSAVENILENAFMCSDENDCIQIKDNFGKMITLTRDEYKKAISEDDIIEECNFLDSCWFSDERQELRYVSEGEVIAIADIGRWNGRVLGYKTISCLEDILYSSCDYEKVYVDGNGDIRKYESHHDGNNSILYRYWKDSVTDEQKENFLNKIYIGELKREDITRYTRKAGLGVARSYGWKVRGA